MPKVENYKMKGKNNYIVFKLKFVRECFWKVGKCLETEQRMQKPAGNITELSVSRFKGQVLKFYLTDHVWE